MTTHIYRVIVRGRFDDLGPTSRAELLAAADDHDALRAAFTRAGTLVYDRRLDFFSLRYEVRVSSDENADPTAAAFADAVEKASRYLAERGLGFRHLVPTGSDLTRIWEND